MFSLHPEMYKFYDTHVRLSAEQRKELASYRDINFDRLKAGLDKLSYPRPARKCDQGSYAMHTTNQHPDNEFDIDVAIIFEKDDLPASPLDARKRIESAMKEGGGNFSKPPEARTNAVTVWYEEGHHVDLAIHRSSTDVLGNEVIEHAGAEWKKRDPMDITDWFNKRVADLSPSKANGATVEERQMRRIVQLLKIFTKSRSSWQESGHTLPGGLIISTLVGDNNYCYVADANSDEKALYDTINALVNRLAISSEVYNPVDSTQALTYKDEYRNQVKRFKEKLEKALEWLAPLNDSSSDKEDVAKAWRQFFNHDYWDEVIEDIAKSKKMSSNNSIYVPAGETITRSSPAKPWRNEAL
jgi:hypothetical protein